MSQTNDDELRAALSRRDPAAGRPVDAASSPQARALWERIMSTAIDQRVPAPRTTAPARPRRRLVLLVAAAAVATGIGVGAANMVSSGPPDRTPQTPARVMTLNTPDGSVAQGCAEFDLAFLQQIPVAFQGNVVEVSDTSAVLHVDRWFRGGQDGITTVRVSRPGPRVSEGVPFAQGQAYLVSARDGFVVSCGYTGALTPDLLTSFEKAFGAR